VALNPATRQLAVAGPHESSIRLWNVDGTPGTILKGHTSVINSLAWSPDGKKLASTSNDQTLRIWSAEGQPLGEAKRHNSATRSVAWMQQRLAVTTANNLLFVWEADGINSAQHPIQTSSINAIAWNENRKVLALATGDHKLRLWSLNGNEPPKEQRSLDAAGVTALAWRPDGKALAAVSNTLLQFNAEDTAGPTIKAAGTTFSGVAYSPDGQRIAIGGADGTLRVFQADGAQTFVSPGHISAIHAVAWSADGKHIATCGHDATLRLWNAANGLEAWNAVALHDDQAVVFGPGGTVVFASEKAGERLVYFVEQPENFERPPQVNDVLKAQARSPRFCAGENAATSGQQIDIRARLRTSGC
jgi:WD40 repeat protein